MPVTNLSRSEGKAAGSLTREVMGTGIVREPAVRSHRSLGYGCSIRDRLSASFAHTRTISTMEPDRWLTLDDHAIASRCMDTF